MLDSICWFPAKGAFIPSFQTLRHSLGQWGKLACASQCQGQSFSCTPSHFGNFSGAFSTALKICEDRSSCWWESSQYSEDRSQLNQNDTSFFVTPIQSPPKKCICYIFCCCYCCFCCLLLLGQPTITDIHCDPWVTSALLAWSSPKGKEPTMKSWPDLEIIVITKFDFYFCCSLAYLGFSKAWQTYAPKITLQLC